MRPARTTACALALASIAIADVWLVGGYDAQFFDIQKAVDAAADGDTILVSHWPYMPFTIDDKSLVVSRRESMWAENPYVGGTIRIQNLSPGKRVVLRGIDVYGNDDSPALIIAHNAGSVRIENMFAWSAYSAVVPPTDPGAFVIDSQDVVFSACFLHAGSGFWHVSKGGAGAHLMDSNVSFFQCLLLGGSGDSGAPGEGIDGGEGGPGLIAMRCSVYSSDSQFFGGNGGDGSSAVDDCTLGGIGPGSGGAGGSGVELLDRNDVLRVAPGEIQGGAGGLRGGGIACAANDGPAGATSILASRTCLLEYDVEPALLVGQPSPAVEGELFELTLRGEPGASVVLYVSASTCYKDAGSLSGIQLVEEPFEEILPFATMPGSGSLTLSLFATDLPPGLLAETWHCQALVTGSSGARWTSPRTLLFTDFSLQ